jgi:hypothetical protein
MSGVGYGRTRGADLFAPFHGVRVPADREDPDKPEARIARLAIDYAPRLRPGQVFCELTALALFGVPVPDSRAHESVVHIAAVLPAAPPRARGTRPHYSTVSRMYRVRELPVCSPVEAWIQSAAVLGVDDLVMIGDALVRRKLPLTTIETLRSAVNNSGGHPGASALREAMTLVRGRTDSPRETLIRLLIARSDLPEPVVNYAVTGVRGEFLGYGDLAYPQWKVVIEYDGEHHFGLTVQRVEDLDRAEKFVTADWRIVQVHKVHLSDDPAEIIERIRVALLAKGWRP